MVVARRCWSLVDGRAARGPVAVLDLVSSLFFFLEFSLVWFEGGKARADKGGGKGGQKREGPKRGTSRIDAWMRGCVDV